MFRLISLAAILLAVADASQYYYAPLGPWGLESTIINVKAVRKGKGNGDTQEIKKTSRKTGQDTDKVDEVKSELGVDDFERAEEAIFHAVEEVEEAVVHAIDDEVETYFPHHKKTEE
ncbi:hypothetical protein ACHAXR_001906 [Thalassiosira sp. AJA248-18]